MAPTRVLITGAAGQIGYALAPMVARGAMFGHDKPVVLHLLDIPQAEEALQGVHMELNDGAFPLLEGVVATVDVEEACKGVDVAVMVGGFPRKEGMERKEVMSKNVAIYKHQAAALEKNAAQGCKVVVVANPANTNALILMEHAPSIPRAKITCLTRLDHNRAKAQVALKAGTTPRSVRNVAIWGNHSATQFPDVSAATVVRDDGKEVPVKDAVKDESWLKQHLVSTVQQRGAAIIRARKASSALSAASAACDHVHDWVNGTPAGEYVSMGVLSDGSYGAPEGVVYSFPVTCTNGEWKIVQGLELDDFAKEKMNATGAELLEERDLAHSCLGE